MENTIASAVERIRKLTLLSRKDEGEILLSYYEELGELATEVKIALGVAGTQYKQPGPDGVYGECADAWICAVSHQCFAFGNVELGGYDEPLSMEGFKQRLSGPTVCPSSMEYYIWRLAMYVNNDQQAFIDKVHQKLDKWERNVKFLEAVDTVMTENKELLSRLAEIERQELVLTKQEAEAVDKAFEVKNKPCIPVRLCKPRYRRWRV